MLKLISKLQKFSGLAILGMMPVGQLAAQNFSLIHSFSNTGDGQSPVAGLIISSNRLYGTTYGGGISNLGTVYAVNLDGSAFANLHNFNPGTNDGNLPNGGLTLVGGKLYGMAQNGGVSNDGVIFSLNLDGSGYAVLHHFMGGDGRNPVGELVSAGNVLYGVTGSGGANAEGAVFAMNIDGSGYAVLHSFTQGTNDGYSPTTGLALSNGRLYGVTLFGGAKSQGAVYALNLDGSGYALLHSFAGGSADGGGPYNGLVLSGNILYGTTMNGGGASSGVIFGLNTDGSGYAVIHSFGATPDDGVYPYGGLAVSGSTLYGTTVGGGASGAGNLFYLNTGTSTYVPIHAFDGSITNGEAPYAKPLVTATGIYGTTAAGGAYGNGVIYGYSLPGPAYALITLTSTNLALPISQWTPIYTNNVNYSQPQQFYILKIQPAP